MKSFIYIGDAPFLPLKIEGKKESIKEMALLDTGAKYVTIRSDLGDVLELSEIRRENLSGFGSKEKFEVMISKALAEVNGFTLEVEIAVVGEERYPDMAPIAIVGRSFLNEYILTLNGEKTVIEEK